MSPLRACTGKRPRRTPLWLEPLEERTLLSVAPISVADPGLYGASGNGRSVAPSLSADGQFVAFISNGDNLTASGLGAGPQGTSEDNVYVRNLDSGVTTLVSVNRDGTAASGEVRDAHISADGRFVAFTSGATDLVTTPDANFSMDVFVRDLQLGVTTLVSVAASGESVGNSVSQSARISPDGRYVFFESFATDLVTESGTRGAFVRDLQAGTTRQVVDYGSGFSTAFVPENISFSDDGRYLVFDTAADLLASDTNNQEDVYRYDLAGNLLELASISILNQSGNDPSTHGSLSSDGRYLAFASAATDLLTTPTPANRTQIFLRDLVLGTTELISTAPNGTTPGNDLSLTPRLSADGAHIAFASLATNLTTIPVAFNRQNFYLYHRLSDSIELVSVNAEGTGGANGDHFFAFQAELAGIAPDGRYVAFSTFASNLVAGDTNNAGDLFVRDTQLGTTVLASHVQGGGNGGNDFSPGLQADAALNLDGTRLVYLSGASNLTANDNNRQVDVFVYDLASQMNLLASARSDALPAAFLAGVSQPSTTSADGRYVVFSSFSNQLATNDFNNAEDVFVHDRVTGTTTLVSSNAAGTGTGSHESTTPVISADGRYVAFLSRAGNLVTGFTPTHTFNVYRRDLATGVTELVSVNLSGGDAGVSTPSSGVAISHDGRSVAFFSTATNLVPGYVNGDPDSFRGDLYVRNLETDSTQLVTINAAGTASGNDRHLITPLYFSADDRSLLFASWAENLVTNDANNAIDLFVRDLQAETTELITVNQSGTAAAEGLDRFNEFSISADGRLVAFASRSRDIVPGDTLLRTHVFVRDRLTQTTRLVSATPTGALSDFGGYDPVLSANGQFVVFRSFSTDLTPLSNEDNHLYVRDLTNNTTRLVSVNAAGTAAGNGQVPFEVAYSVSADGQLIAYLNASTNLVQPFEVDPAGPLQNVYLFNQTTGVTTLLSRDLAGVGGLAPPPTDGFLIVRRPELSSNGSRVYFTTNAPNLYRGDTNSRLDLYVASTAPGNGVISGRAFRDDNANQVKDDAEPVLVDWLLYLDADNDGDLDPSEPTARTNAAGLYAFTGLEVGTYLVRQALPSNGVQTLPLANAPYEVALDSEDAVVTDRDFGARLLLPDLMVDDVSVPASANLGETATVTWTVRNIGTFAASGNWQDALYLSRDGTLDATDLLLALAPHSGGLAANGFYQGNALVTLPAVLPGDYRILVQTDRRRQLDEANTANNLAPSPNPITLGISTLALGVPFADAFTTPNQSRYYQVIVPAGQTLRVALDSSATSGGVELYVRRVEPPTPYAFDAASRVVAQPDQEAVVPLTQAGVYYVLAQSRFGAAATSSFSVTARTPGFALDNIDLDQGGNTGRVTVALRGSNFTADARASLVPTLGGPTLNAAVTDFRDASLLFATFDLNGAPLGAYDVVLSDGVQNAALLAAFQVVPGQASRVQATLSAPQFIRAGREHSVIVTYRNRGNVDAPAPLLLLSVTEGKGLLRPLEHPGFNSNAVLFLAIGREGPAGIVRPGQEEQLTFAVLSITDVGHDPLEYRLQEFASANEAINWPALKEDNRPTDIDPLAWDAIWANFTSGLGTTTGSFNARLAQRASYLSQLGIYTASLERLWGGELLQADSSLGGIAAIEAVDAALPTPGIPLVLKRSWASNLSGRYRLGALGRGWSHNWEISASTDEAGTVTLASPNGDREFTLQFDGSYLGLPGDRATLTRTVAGYRLEERDGGLTLFNADGTLASVQDRFGNRVVATHSGGKLVALTHSGGAALALSYDDAGRLREIEDTTGRKTLYAYDSAGQLASVTAAGGTLHYTYDTSADPRLRFALRTLTDPNGVRLTLDYDARGRLISQAYNDGAQPQTYTYDGFGGITVHDADGGDVTILHNDLGQVEQITDALNRVTTYDYDANGNPIRIVTPTGLTHTFGYDARGNLIRQVNPLGQVIDLSYDLVSDHLVSITDPRGNKTQYGYDALSNLRSITAADGGREEFAYDALGNLTEAINQRQRAIGYETDHTTGLLTRKTFADGSAQAFNYDARGNLVRARSFDGNDNLTYEIVATYDPVTDELTRIDYVTDGRFLEFTNENGRVVERVDQAGYKVRRVYDAAGRLVELNDGAQQTPTFFVRYGYDDAGRLSRKEQGNGTFTTFAYDAAGQLVSLVNHKDATTINSRFDYTYDAAGRRASMTLTDNDEHTTDGTTLYEYDALGQLTGLMLPGGRTIEYRYDAAGNRTAVLDSLLGTTAYTANAVNEYTEIDGVVQSYDADGNLTFDGVNTFTWDDENQLLSVSNATNSWTYEYDPFGNRRTSSFNGQTTSFLFDPSGFTDIVGAYDGAGGLIARYTHGLGLVSRTDATGAATYYDFDALGSTTGLTDDTGGYVARYTSLSFGETTRLAGTFDNPFTFVGQHGIVDNGGRFLMRARTYSATTGQFVSNDPLGLGAGDFNFRRYVYNAPTLAIDPSGLSCVDLSKVGVKINTLFSQLAKLGAENLENFENRLVSAVKVNAKAYNFAAADRAASATILKSLAKGLTAVNVVANSYSFYEHAKAGQTIHAVKDAFKVGLGLVSLGGFNPTAAAFALAFGVIEPFGDAILDRLEPPRPDNNVQEPIPGESLTPCDPNQITGPAGVGAANFLGTTGVFGYTIAFENDPEIASAPAQDVTITHALDSDLDWSTFRLGNFGFGALVVPLPEGLQEYATSVDYHNADGSPLRVDMSARFDLTTGVASWTFRSIDPATGTWPEDAFAGFLPVNDDSLRGEGFVSYTIQPRADLPTGREIRAVAGIVFDLNVPVFTNQKDPHDPSQGSDPTLEALVTIDAGAPTSRVHALPANTGTPSFLLSWSGSDDAGGSGVATYDIFFSTNDGPFVPLLTATTATTTVFDGAADQRYAFYSVATDRVGNREAVPAEADAVTQMVVANTVTKLSVVATATSGKTVKFTATVKLRPGARGRLAGEVAFVEGITLLGTAPLKSVNGVLKATFRTSALELGSHNIEALYPGNGQLTTSISTSRPLHVFSPTTTAVVSDAPTAVRGAAVTFTATVTAGAPGAGTPLGVVSFFDTFNGSKRLLGTASVDSQSGQATLTVNDLRKGSHTIRASYAPVAGSDFAPSKAPGIRQVIQATASLRVAEFARVDVLEEALRDTAVLDRVFALLGTKGPHGRGS